tara:strand:+ start:389 stop:622 length:234 start_codon:yes stop_codon:yes gene_type:complete
MPGCLIHDFHGESYTRPERGKQGMVIVMIQTPTIHIKASQYAGLLFAHLYGERCADHLITHQNNRNQFLVLELKEIV